MILNPKVKVIQSLLAIHLVVEAVWSWTDSVGERKKT